MFSKQNKEVIYIILIILFSIFFNQFYGYLGINPIDSFFSFNTGYDILNGHYPFKDYWTITGPFIGAVQAIFFKIFGVSWFSYVLHASFFNCLISLSTFFILYKFKLNIHYCFIYSLFTALLAYPSSGTPYVDHQSSYLSVISIFCFILALKTNSRFYWFILPIIIVISFLTKQTPTGHFFLIIVFLSTIYFFLNFNLEKILFGLLGSLIIILIFSSTLLLGKIPFQNFIHQYILFPLSLGEDRLEFLFPLEFKRIILRYKIIHLFSLVLIAVCAKKVLNNYKFLISNDFLIVISLILSSFALIAHQLMTINGQFIFFIIPILAGFTHIYYLKNFSYKKNILYFLVFLTLASTTHYFKKYIHDRDFPDLRNVNKEHTIDGKILDKKLTGLKWITPLYPDNPTKEITRLKEVIYIIKNDTKRKIIVTDYQFISVINESYDYSPSQVWFGYHVNPIKGSKYFRIYKKFLLEKLKENNIEVIYTVKPLWGGNDVLVRGLNKDCFTKSEITVILDKYLLRECSELND